MHYTVFIKRSAEKEMDRLPAAAFERVRDAVVALEADPRPKASRKLRAADSWRLRVGSYRILYTIDDARRVVEVIAVGHRRVIYRGL